MALGESLGVESELIPRVATGFCGGVGSTHRHICGALSGAVIATGIAFGRDKAEESKDRAIDFIKELLRGFRQEFGHTECYQLVGLAPDDERFSEKWSAWNMGEEKCVHFVRSAVRRWLELAGR
ncbi:MAG: C-GCAxxG-C-C family protein [Anaerolineae bacterium]|nr:C-GCAxxG-C-C family protein [Anaerolineae bacterium]